MWTYPWLWAVYLLKTGDTSFVKANFTAEGPSGKTEPSIKDTAHLIAADRTGPGGIMEKTNDIDANGYWTIDNYEALMGLWADHWLAQKVGDASEAKWAAAQYASLLKAVNKTLDATIAAGHLNYLPCSMTEPNTANRCVNAEDANWAAPFLFGRWAWDGSLFGAPRVRAGPQPDRRDLRLRVRPAGREAARQHLRRLPDPVLQHRLQRRLRRMGPGQRGLPQPGHRVVPVHGEQHPERPVLVVGERAVPQHRLALDRHPPRGRQRLVPARLGHRQRQHGAAGLPGRARSDGSLVVGRGVPDSWVRGGQVISLANFPPPGAGTPG